MRLFNYGLTMYADKQEKETRTIDLISSVKDNFWKLSIPLILFFLFETFYGIIDTFWVVNYSNEAGFAVSYSQPILLMVITFGFSIGMGTNSIMSRYIGSNNYESAYNSFMHGIILSIIMSVVLIILCIPFLNLFLGVIEVENEHLLYEYLFPQIACSSLILLTNLFSETFQAEGNSKTPIKILIISNIINLILDPIFIYYFNMGVSGASWASIIAYFLCVGNFLYFYMSDKTKIPLNLKYFKVNRHICFEISKVSIPIFIEDINYSLLIFIVNTLLISLIGPMGVLAFSISLKIKYTLLSPIKGMGRGLMIITGHLFGAKKINKLNDMYMYTLKITISLALVTSTLFFIFRDLIYASFLKVTSHTPIFSISIVMALMLTIFPFYYLSSMVLAGLGKSYYSLVLEISKNILMVVLMLTLKNVLSGANTIFVSSTICEVLFALIFFICLKLLIKKLNRNLKDIAVD